MVRQWRHKTSKEINFQQSACLHRSLRQIWTVSVLPSWVDFSPPMSQPLSGFNRVSWERLEQASTEKAFLRNLSLVKWFWTRSICSTRRQVPKFRRGIWIWTIVLRNKSALKVCSNGSMRNTSILKWTVFTSHTTTLPILYRLLASEHLLWLLCSGLASGKHLWRIPNRQDFPDIKIKINKKANFKQEKSRL